MALVGGPEVARALTQCGADDDNNICYLNYTVDNPPRSMMHLRFKSNLLRFDDEY